MRPKKTNVVTEKVVTCLAFDTNSIVLSRYFIDFVSSLPLDCCENYVVDVVILLCSYCEGDAFNKVALGNRYAVIFEAK